MEDMQAAFNKIIDMKTNSLIPQEETSTPSCSEQMLHDAMVTVYFFERLKSVYGSIFERIFTTQTELLNSQDEWKVQIGKMTRDDIDHGIERLKELMTEDLNYKWPNIALTIGLCKRKIVHACHKENFPRLPKFSTEQMRVNRAKTLDKLKELSQVNSMRRATRMVKDDESLTPSELETRRQRQDFEKQILSEARANYSYLNSSS